METLIRIFVSGLLALIGTFCFGGFSFCSDWEEESIPSRTAQPRVIEDQAAPSKQKLDGGGMLQGSATAVHSHEPTQLSRNPRFRAAISSATAVEQARQANELIASLDTNVNTPPAVFRAWLSKAHPDFALSAQSLNPDLVVEVRGHWDDSDRTLKSLGIRHVSIKARELRSASLAGTKVLVVNCAGEVPREVIQKIRDFVIQGGYLLSTDWSLNNLVEKAFPNYIAWNGVNTDGAVVDAFVIDSAPELLEGVPVRRTIWKLDRGSQAMTVKNVRKVRVLARSSKLAQTDLNFGVAPDPLLVGALAAEFSLGRGKVLHLVGHFDNNGGMGSRNLLPDPSPSMGISLRQALATNFIVSALKTNLGRSQQSKSLETSGNLSR